MAYLHNYFFQKVTQFSQGNNMLHPPVSNTNDCLWRITCVSSTQQNMPIWIKLAFLNLENYDLQEVFLTKTY
jgi:hypothetical protein